MAQICSIDTAGAARELKGSSCAFGVFDGVHLGHRHLIEQACSCARSHGAPSAVLTFDRDPDELFHPERLRKLQSNELRLEMLAATGVDHVLVIPFTHSFAAHSPQEFLDVLFGIHLPAAVHVGSNFRFGAKAAGTVETMRNWAQDRQMAVYAHELVSNCGVPISSTRIRLLLEEGAVEQANQLLGHPYQIRGIVREGRHDGQRFGFRTANMHLERAVRALSDGVYAGYAWVEGMRYRAAISVGESPMFAGRDTASCEVHILDFSGDLYGKTIDVEFQAWLRPMMQFSTVDELVCTVEHNIAWVRDNMPLN